MAVQDALVDLDLVSRPLSDGGDRVDFRAQVHGVGDQPLLVGFHVEDAGVAGVVGAFKDRDGALHQVQAGGVLELESEQGELGLGALVVDADARALHVLVDDGQQGRLLPRQRHRLVDGVLEEVAQLGRRRHRRDARLRPGPSPAPIPAALGRYCLALRLGRRRRERPLFSSSRLAASSRCSSATHTGAAVRRRRHSGFAVQVAVVGDGPERGEQLGHDRRPRHVQRRIQVHLEADGPAATPGPCARLSSPRRWRSRPRPSPAGTACLPSPCPAPAGSSSSRSGSR